MPGDPPSVAFAVGHAGSDLSRSNVPRILPTNACISTSALVSASSFSRLPTTVPMSCLAFRSSSFLATYLLLPLFAERLGCEPDAARCRLGTNITNLGPKILELIPVLGEVIDRNFRVHEISEFHLITIVIARFCQRFDRCANLLRDSNAPVESLREIGQSLLGFWGRHGT